VIPRSIASNTLKSYNQGFRAWSRSLPVNRLHLAAFISSVVQRGETFGKIEHALYSLNWIHNFFDLPNPCDSWLVRCVKNSAKRLLKTPVVKKCPIRPRHLRKLVRKFGSSSNLLDLRICAIALLSYAGFLRYDEVSRIRRSNITFERTYIKLFIESSKTDQEGIGEHLFIARTRRSTCPYGILKRYLKRAGMSRPDTNFVFRPVVRTKNGHRVKNVEKPVSCTTARDQVMGAIRTIGLDRTMFGMHSFRRGGAMEAAWRGISDRLFKKHGRWKSDNAKDGYVSEDLETRLSVTQNLGV
jgi:integrase